MKRILITMTDEQERNNCDEHDCAKFYLFDYLVNEFDAHKIEATICELPEGDD